MGSVVCSWTPQPFHPHQPQWVPPTCISVPGYHLLFYLCKEKHSFLYTWLRYKMTLNADPLMSLRDTTKKCWILQQTLGFYTWPIGLNLLPVSPLHPLCIYSLHTPITWAFPSLGRSTGFCPPSSFSLGLRLLFSNLLTLILQISAGY